MEIIVEGSTVYNGDCLEVMDKLEKCSVDSIVTDPPYHLSDMTKRYGKKKGEAIFYAMENSGKLKGVKKKSSRNK